MSDSSQPHGPKPTRLLCPWDFPGQSTGVGCHYSSSIKGKWRGWCENQLIISQCLSGRSTGSAWLEMVPLGSHSLLSQYQPSCRFIRALAGGSPASQLSVVAVSLSPCTCETEVLLLAVGCSQLPKAPHFNTT